MKKILALLGTVVFTGGVASALDIVYPQGKYNQTYHDNVFFMGTVDEGEDLYFQGERVQTAKNGAFVINVPLKQGRNQVFLKSSKDGRNTIKQFYITRRLQPAQAQNTALAQLTPLSKTAFKTVVDSAVLRYTPSLDGLNKMSTLSKNTKLIVDGRQGDFFRVYLTPTKSGWIHRKDVTLLFDDRGYPAKPDLSKYYSVEDKTVPDMSLYRVAFSANLPYEIVDSPNELLINVFNVSGMNEETLVLRITKNELVKYNALFSNGDLTLIMKNIAKKSGGSLNGLTIVLDAGHGGLDKGAFGMFREDEKNYNIEVATRLKSLLEARGANVYMTRHFDEDVATEDRAKFTKAHGADIFLSIHMGSVVQGENPLEYSGSRAYYYNNTSKNLAEILNRTLVKGLKTADNGVVQKDYEVLQTGEYLAAQVELCSMINATDADIYRAPDFASNAALSLCNGIEEYVLGVSNIVDSAKLLNTPSAGKSVGKVKKERVKRERVKKERPTKVKEVSAEIVTPKEKPKRERVKHNTDEKPFLDTSVRDKYQQEAIYVYDKNDTKWYRPNGKKKRAKRPAREIKHTHVGEQENVNIFASGDYETYVAPEPSFGQKTRNFFSKVTSYFYNGARN